MRNPIRPIIAKLQTSHLISAAIHGLILLALIGVWHTRRVAGFKLPGTTQGDMLITYYSPGAPPHAVSDIPAKEAIKPKSATRSPITAPKSKPQETGSPAASPGTGNSVESGLGEGDIKIALQTYNPYPKPSLSSLARGTVGDVVLNAVIDEHGKITDLTLLKGLGPSIDDTIIATVKQWSFSPATRNGVPIPSEQELHFHYERG